MPNMKAKKKRHTAITVVKTMKTVVTLSDRLKIAGIKEIKPQCGGKQIRNLNKSSKKRKSNKIEMGKHRNVLAQIYSKNSTTKRKKIVSENSSKSSTNSNRNLAKKSAEETLNVSLDFIKDCKKYKRKFRNPKSDFPLNNQRTKTSFTDSRQNHIDKEEPQTLRVRNSVSKISEEKEAENYPGNECCFFNKSKCEKLNKKEKIDDELRCFGEEESKAFYDEPAFYKKSLCDVAKIDKKYLESVLSLASHLKLSKKKDVEKGETEKGRAKHLTAKNNSETKNKDQGAGFKYEKNSESSEKSLKKEEVSVRILRDSTKSEVQFYGMKKMIGSQRNSEELKIEKEVAQSKSELKKRKPRNKILKSNNKELIEIPFSSEVSQAKDVKEIWRRETKKISENSLTSNSSSTIPEIEENSKWKNFGLQSYRILHKLVEEEINKISKKSEMKNNTIDVKNKDNNMQQVHESNAERGKVNLNSKNIINKLKLPRNEIPVNEKETLYAKKKLLVTRNLHAYEGDKSKTQLLSMLNQDSVKTPKGDLKFPEAKKTKGSKFPEQSIDNWSILNRLEQAFLALGNTNFKNDFTSKTKQACKNNSAQNCEISKKNSKEMEEPEPKTSEKIKLKTQTTKDTLNRKDPGADIRKPEGSKLRSKSNYNDWVFPRRKSEVTKLPSCSLYSAQCKEKIRKNEQSSLGPFDQGEIKEFSPRKKTNNANLLKNFSVQPKYSSLSIKTNLSVKSEKKKLRECVKQISKDGSKNRGKDEMKMKSLHCNQNTEKKEVTTKPPHSKNLMGPPGENIHGIVKSGIPKPRVSQKIKSERTEPVENRLNNQIPEKKETNQKSFSERSVKERSILSVHGKQKENEPSMEKFNAIQEKTSSNTAPTLKSNTGDLLMKHAQKNFEDLYRKSTFQLKTNKSNASFIEATLSEKRNSSSENISKPNSNNKFASTSKHNMSPHSRGGLTSASNISQVKIFQNNPGLDENPRELTQSKTLFLWEKDIRRYREIVNDIMSQYKRIDGFLKHSDTLGISSSSKIGSDLSSKSCSNEKTRKFFNDSQLVNLQEYRKKIVTEYQALPFFEYKQLDRGVKINLQEPKKRALSVVSDVNKEMDFDVKDYQPKITKVLDSQLYVDKEDLFKKNSENTPKHKKLSLQEIFLCRDKNVFHQHCLKTYSLSKTLRLPGSEICSVPSNDQKQKL